MHPERLQAAHLGLTSDTGEDSADAQANLAPLLDTIFLIIAVLLVALMNMTAVEGLPIRTLGRNDSVVSTEQTQRVEVVLSLEGSTSVDGMNTAAGDLVATLQEIQTQRHIDVVYLLAHSNVDYGRVADVLMRLQRPDNPPVFLGVVPEPIPDGE